MKNVILITGSRKWEDRNIIHKCLSVFPVDNTFLIHGGAKGADEIAGDIAQELGMSVEPYNADWEKHGRRAGPMRNTQMVNRLKELSKDHYVKVFAFIGKSSIGTVDCIQKLENSGFEVEKHYDY